MKHLASNLWAIAFAFLGFAILAQMAIAIIAPFIPWILGALGIGASAFITYRLWSFFNGGGPGNSLTRGH